MTLRKALLILRRFALPALCGLLAVVSVLWGEQVLVEAADKPTVGPLVAAQIAGMVAIGFATLALITLLLVLVPGKEPDQPTEADLSDLDLDETIQTDPDTQPEAEALHVSEAPGPEHGTEAGPPSAKKAHPADRSAEDVIAALTKAATRQAAARQQAEDREAEALVRVQALQATLDALRDGTAPEIKALKAQVRDEANREAMRKVHELGQASERLHQALKDARARTERDLAAKDKELADRDAALLAAQDQIPEIQHAAALDEYQRIRIALEAVNHTHIDVLDHLQRDAVAKHAARITDALNRLDPARSPDFGPDVDMPPMDPGSPPPPRKVEESDLHSHRRSRRLRRKKR